MRKSFIDAPVIDLSLRKFEKPSGAFNELLRKFCISIGLLQPGDSRDVVVDLLALFIKASKVKRLLSINEVYRHFLSFDKPGVSQSNIRRHLFRLKELDFVEKHGDGYRLREWLSLTELFEELVNFKIKPTVGRIKEYSQLIDES